jgi:hypothetical protein
VGVKRVLIRVFLALVVLKAQFYKAVANDGGHKTMEDGVRQN